MIDFKEVKKVYFLGIGGIGVSAIARMFLHEGMEVCGSDTAESEITTELMNEGALIFIGQDISHIPEDADLVIYTIAIEKFAPDFLNEVRKKIKNVISYPETLSIISKNKYTIAICGTHGKTTTTAMVAKIMIDAGLDPTVIVGSILNDVHSNFIAGKSKYLVVEACEYCRSFLEINPTVVGITTIDNDHMDYYKDEEDILSAFAEFTDKATEIVVGNVKNDKIQKVVGNKKSIDSDDFFDKNLRLKIPGEHNRRNASVALAIAEFLGVPKNSAIASLENFSGTWRRFEYKGKTNSGAIVYDDYAHHPAEIKATLLGARELYPEKEITIVFQPHLYSRTKIFLDDFAEVLSKADHIIITDIYAAREENDNSISGKILTDKITQENKNTLFISDFKDIALELQKNASEKDIIIIMGAGDISQLPEILLSK